MATNFDGKHATPEILRGWKEIAQYLGFSIKTAQRYAQELDLPVRRNTGQQRGSVWAFREDLNSWLGACPHGLTEQPVHETETSHQTARPEASPVLSADPFKSTGIRLATSRRLLLFLSTALLAGAAFMVWRPFDHRGPASWDVRQNRLLALDSRGGILWEQTFEFPLNQASYTDPNSSLHPPVTLEDLDGDGRRELLFLAIDGVRKISPGFFCFNSDGSVRFSVEAAKPRADMVEFGDQRYHPPFHPCLFHVGTDSQGGKSVFVVSEQPSWFPAVVRKFSPAGQLLGEFWHSGHIQRLLDVTLTGRRLLLAGAMNNENFAASLAVLDYERVSGSTPAVNPRYACRNCPAGSPLAYLVFPRTEVSRALDHRPYVQDLKVDTNNVLTVIVSEGGGPPPGDPGSWAYVFYRLDEGFRFLSADFDDYYRRTHSRLTLAGVLDHPLSPVEAIKQQEKMLSWAGDRFTHVGDGR